MGAAEPAPVPGRESRGRTILVIDEQPYLWAVLRQRVEPRTAYVRAAAPDQLAAVWRRCLPWPWLVVGAIPSLPPDLAELMADRPIPIHWLGDPPAGLPGRATTHADWTELAAALERLNDLCDHGPAGVRLLRNRGLEAPGGRLVLHAAHVEALLAAGQGLAVPPGAGDRAAAAAQAEIDEAGLPLRIVRTGDVLSLA